MKKLLVSIPDNLDSRLRAAVPNRQRSRVIARLIEKEIEKREQALFNCAAEVEHDETLNREMMEWEEKTRKDGLDDESW